MAKKRGTPSATSVNTQRYDKELIEDISDYHLGENIWTHARNAITNSTTGDYGDIGNEPSNLHCASAPYTIIGTVHVQGDKWVIFSTDDSNSEIGLFDESECSYYTLVNAPCLAFNRTNLITGISKENFDCRWGVYWADGLNPDRYLIIDIETPSNNDYTNPESTIPWIQDCVDDNGPLPGGCIICTNTPDLDCDKIRLEDLITAPCFSISRGVAAGTVRNGSYFVVGAYTLDTVKIGDWSIPSEVQPIFTHNNVGASLEIQVDFADERFDEMQVVLVSFVNEQTTARIIGTYSTRQKVITLDFIDDRWEAVDLNEIPVRTAVYNKSDGIYRNGDYAIRIGPTGKFDFNYQPLANQIVTKWKSVEYDEAYYYNGGNNTNYLRDEVYSFFIRWVYSTGDKSASYHIPGRPQFNAPYWVKPVPGGGPTLESGTDTFDALQAGEPNWVVYNTAVVSPNPALPLTLPDGGVLISEGYMGYWESTEFYDDDNPEVWNANVNAAPYVFTDTDDYNLCGKRIRHHKFPDAITDLVGGTTKHYRCAGNAGPFALEGKFCKIRIMGVGFQNIQAPVLNPQDPPADWVPVPGIVGYEILRGSRTGNKSILAKGIVNNMGQYDLDGDPDSSVNYFSTRNGLVPNYPFNDLGPDPFLSNTSVTWETDQEQGYSPIVTYPRNILSFHSPDTQFSDPFLSTGEMKVYGEVVGYSDGNFVEPIGHPKHKFVTDAAFIAGILVGLGYALTAMNGKKNTTFRKGQAIRISGSGDLLGGYSIGYIDFPSTLSAATFAAAQALELASEGAYWGLSEGGKIQGLADALLGTTLSTDNSQDASEVVDNTNGYANSLWTQSFDQDGTNALPNFMKTISSFVTFYNYFTEGVDTTLDVIRAFSRFRQFALQGQFHCKYGVYGRSFAGNRRFAINDARYIDPYMQDFTDNYRINNLNRNRFVALSLGDNLDPCQNVDTSKVTIGEVAGGFTAYDHWETPTAGIRRLASSHYVGLKQQARNQYGQLQSIVQVPVSTCVSEIGDGSSEVFFNGDTYIGRHTEKNKMPFFYDWLLDQIDGTEFNYKLHQSVPHVRYWMDTEEFEWADFINSIGTALGSPPSSGSFLSQLVTPSDLHNFDRNGTSGTGFFMLKNCYMYLFVCGIRDFFVESSINVDLRDWDEAPNQRHYHPYSSYTDLDELFSSRIMRSDNYFKYDFNLSISKLFNNYITWGNMQTRDYNPNDAEACFEYRPKRMIYSLPQKVITSKRDNWKTFLPLNFKDFVSRPVAVKPIYTSGAIILFENESPVMFKGVEQLTTAGDTKIIIGDGALFEQPLQNMSNSDRPYEYGSCQNGRSFINTPYGAFYMSQNQGKIFLVTSSLKEISMPGKLKWWFSTFLPYTLTNDFPDFELKDNPVIGIGCQAIYDNENQIVYFCKKDYIRRRTVPTEMVEYVGGNQFLIDKLFNVELGDPRYFEDASWTVSYDLKRGTWVGWHDWHPDLLMGGKTNFMSISQNAANPNQANGIWIHNRVCDSYCNFYGVNYPFEVEFPVNTLQTVNTLRSIEYQLEAYRYDPNCYDRFHVLDFNFDQAVVYNSEQCSGMLNLNLSPKNNAPQIVQYPIINLTSIDILYSKEEQKYRFNQFWDITDDRGEFTNVERVIWNTEPNGYVRLLNPANLNYNKYQTERKRFRHYENMVFLRRRKSGNRKILLMLTNAKNHNSPR